MFCVKTKKYLVFLAVNVI